jgi:PAS domain-containing protein
MNSVSLDSEPSESATDSRIIETINEKTMQNNATRRKQVEVEQSRSQATTEKSALEGQMTFDAIDSPVLILDLTGRVVRLNQAAKELSENTRTEVSGKAGCFTGAGLPWQNVSQIVQSVRETGSAVSCQATDEVSGKTWNITANIILGPQVNDERYYAQR